MNPLRIYTDTSVIGGYFDLEFREYSQRFIEQARQGRIILLLSDIVFKELRQAPEPVRQLLNSVPLDYQEFVEETEQAVTLREAYLNTGILSRKSQDDATHVALATLHQVDAIVSWNFKHIVRLDKMKMFNQINKLHGYEAITIISPKEVLLDEFRE